MPVERTAPRAVARTAVVWDVLRDALAALAADLDVVRVLDVGGGTGGFAVPLAQLGHPVVVVDPSPDSLAALERRAAETGTAELVRGVQGDAAGVLELVEPGSIDLVLCHSVLEVVDDPAEALAALTAVLAPAGVASVLVANRVAAVLARVAAGRFAEAQQLLAGNSDEPPGSTGPRRWFDLAEVDALVTGAGLRPRSTHGVRVFADLAPAGVLEADARAVAELVELERAAAAVAAYAAVATQLHVLADRD